MHFGAAELHMNKAPIDSEKFCIFAGYKIIAEITSRLA